MRDIYGRNRTKYETMICMSTPSYLKVAASLFCGAMLLAGNGRQAAAEDVGRLDKFIGASFTNLDTVLSFDPVDSTYGTLVSVSLSVSVKLYTEPVPNFWPDPDVYIYSAPYTAVAGSLHTTVALSLSSAAADFQGVTQNWVSDEVSFTLDGIHSDSYPGGIYYLLLSTPVTGLSSYSVSGTYTAAQWESILAAGVRLSSIETVQFTPDTPTPSYLPYQYGDYECLVTYTYDSVPEPAAWAMFTTGAGVVLLWARARRRNHYA